MKFSGDPKETVVGLYAIRAAAKLAEKLDNRFGIDWLAIIAIILPIILDCFQGPEDMRRAFEEGFTPMQKLGLNLRVRKVVNERRSSRLPLLLPRHVDEIAEVMLAEATWTASAPSNDEDLRRAVDNTFGDAGVSYGEDSVFEAIWNEARLLQG